MSSDDTISDELRRLALQGVGSPVPDTERILRRARHLRTRRAATGAIVAVCVAAVVGVGLSGRTVGAHPRPGPIATGPTPSDTPTPAPKPLTYKGRGDAVLNIAKPDGLDAPALITISGDGSSGNFAVTSLDSSLRMVDRLVNTIGAYSGTRVLDPLQGQQTARLKIEYPGTWTVVIHSIRTATPFSTTAAGTGDSVLLYAGDAGSLAVTNRGSSNFAVTTSADNGVGGVGAGWETVLVNETGDYTGTVALGAGPALIEIQSDGTWTLKFTG